MFEVTVLAILQGIAEFLPISSSGHLVLGKALLGVSEPGIRLDVMLHAGTLLSVTVFYFAVIWRILRNFEWRYMLKVIVSAVPCAIVGILFKTQLESLFASPAAVGVALLFTGAVLIATRFLPRGGREVSLPVALAMGVAQAVAVLPGVSRSGMTIAAARASKVDGEKAAEFSFLMSVPPIAGAALLEVLDSLKASDPAADGTAWPLVVYGGLVAAVVGFVALKLLLRSLRGDRFWLFGVYCLAAGTVTILVG